jgi:hypothetical protein
MPREAGYFARRLPLARKSHNDHAEPQRNRGRRESVRGEQRSNQCAVISYQLPHRVTRRSVACYART